MYGVDVPNLETVCMTHLKEKGWTFATAESCTGGQIAARITAPVRGLQCIGAAW